MTFSSTTSVEQLITCVVCHESFDDPRILPCSHTYCRKCIEQMASANKDQFECPLCGGSLVAKNNINSLSINKVARDLVELYGSVQHSNKCSNCDSAVAEYGCTKCENESFCSQCYQTVHTPRVMQKHQPIPISEKSPEMISCETHLDYITEYWCHTCGVLACSDCLLFEHKDHMFAAMSEVAKELEIKIYNDLESIQSSLDYRLNRAQTLIIAIDHDSNLNTRRIKESMELLRQMIDDHEKIIVQEILTIEAKQKKQIEDSKTLLRNELQSLTLRKATLEMLSVTNDRTKLLKSKQGFDDYVNKTNETLKTTQTSTRIDYYLAGLDQMQELKNKLLQYGRYIEYSNPELEKLITRNGTKQQLDLTCKKFIDQDMKIVADALRKSTTLTKLYLYQDQIGDQGARHLADALKQNKTITQLYLQQNQIGDQGAQHIADALKQNTTLTQLYLNQNQIGDQGVQHLANALKQNKTLTQLYLHKNQIGDQGAQRLVNVLKHNTTLTLLSLQENIIGREGVGCMKETLKANTKATVYW